MDASFYYLVRNASQYYLYILKNPNDQVVDDITEYVDYLQWTIDIKEWPLLRNEAMREKDIMVQNSESRFNKTVLVVVENTEKGL